MDTVSLVLPFPPAACNPNARVPHPSVRWRAEQNYREACRIDAFNVRREMERQGMRFPLLAPVTMLLTFVLTSRQRRDWDNLVASWKHGQDGIVQAGLIHDDNVWELRVGIEVERGDTQAVRVRLQGAEASG